MRSIALSPSRAADSSTPAPAAPERQRGTDKFVPPASIRLDFPTTFDPVVTEQLRRRVVRLIAKRAVELLGAQQ